ncbi:MAG: leucine-rich repeat domain-containing protein, partial [Leptospirales bacterium]
IRKRISAAGFHLLFSLYALTAAPFLLTRLRASVEGGQADPALAWIILTVGLLEIPALYWKIQAVARRLGGNSADASRVKRPGLLFAGWLCHFVLSGPVIFAFFDSLGWGTKQSDPHLQAAIVVWIGKEFWLGGLLFLAQGRRVSRALERLCDLALFAFACMMHTVFWQLTIEGSSLDVYSLPLLFMNLGIIAFFFLLSYTATQLPYLWQHSASLSDEKEFSRWLLSLIGTAILAVVPILYAALDGRFGDLRKAVSAARENPRQVRALALNRSELKSLSPEIGELPYLRSLYLHENRLRALPPEIGRLGRLETLQISYNRLEFLPDDVGRLENLKTLRMYGNRLRRLPDSLGGLAALEELHTGWNPLERLPDTVTNLKHLRVLNASNCRLNTLPEDIGRLETLRILKAPNNRLATVPESLFDLALDELDLRGNPLPAGLLERIQRRYPAPE